MKKTKSPLEVLLLITLGTQDVKLWKADAGKVTGEEISFSATREMHLAIRNCPGEWEVATESQAREAIAVSAEPRAGAKGLAVSLEATSPIFSIQGRLLLKAAKLEPVVEALLELREKIKIVGALVFYTERLESIGEQRTSKRHFSKEPIASGDVVTFYLRHRLELNPEYVDAINCFEGCAGQYEGGAEDHDDFPLRRKIVHRTDNAVRAFVDRNKHDLASVVPATMTTGGIGALKDVVSAIADLRFYSTVRDLSFPEVSEEEPQWCDLIEARLRVEQPILSRAEAIRARGRALHLLSEGDPVSAWASVCRFAGSELDKWWLEPLELTAAYFGASISDTENRLWNIQPAPENHNATETWSRALSEVDLNVEGEFKKHKRFALNAAMRAELALQGSDRESRRVSDALMAVCTMLDAALIATAFQFIEQDVNKQAFERWLEENDKASPRSFFGKENEQEMDASEFGIPNGRRNSWLRREVKGMDAQFSEFLESYFAELIDLDSVITPDREEVLPEQDSPSLRDLRNTASHRALSSRDIEKIATLAEESEVPLWSPPGQKPLGCQILSMAPCGEGGGLIHAVLEKIGISDAAGQYQRLIGGLEEILLTCEPERGP